MERRRLPAAAALTVLLSLVASGPRLLLRWRAESGGDAPSSSPFSLRPEAVSALEVYRLATYAFAYEDAVSLACGAVIVWYFAGSFEGSVGTVRHCLLTVAFAVASALLYLLLWVPVAGLWPVAALQGFSPVALAMLAASVARSPMRRTLLFGFGVRMALVPWLLLGLACLVPNSSFLGNACGLLVGNVYGYGHRFGVDLSEPTVARLERRLPFRLLKRIPGLRFVPGSLAERRASQSRRLNPVPGSYPTQSYHSPPPVATFAAPPVQPRGAQALPPGPPGLAPQPAASVPGGTPAMNHFHPPPSGPYPAVLPFGGSNWQAHSSGAPQPLGVPAGGHAPEAGGPCRVHVG